MKNIFTEHRLQLLEMIEEGEMAILFAGSAPKSTADASYDFMTNKNFYYFTGCDKEQFIVVMHNDKGQMKSTLFIEKPNYDVEKWFGRKLTQEAARELSGIEDILYLDVFENWLNRLIVTDHVKAVYLDLEKLSFDEAHSVANLFSKKLIDRYPFLPIKTLHPLVVKQRMIKSETEISKIQKAVDLTHEGLKAVLNYLKPDVYEYQVQSVFEHTIKMNGADGVSFPTIAVSGDDGVILHYVENNKKIKEGDLILLDLGAAYQEYAGDISRTFPASGVYSERQKTIYNIVLKAQEAVMAEMKPGTPFAKLNETCIEVLTKALLEDGLIQSKEEVSKYYYHGVSHHLGLDVHDISDREAVLQPGMVLTCEPGLYIAEEGIGIRIEDDVLITEEGHQVLSQAIPKTVEEIEAIMKK